MNDPSRRRALGLAAAAGAAALAETGIAHAAPPRKQPPKHNGETVVESKAAAESYGPRELFAVVDEAGNLRRGLHVVTSRRLEDGVYEVIFNRDIRRGVYLVTPGGHGYTGVPPTALASVVGRATDPRGVLVYMANMEGDPFATGFHLLVICPEGFA